MERGERGNDLRMEWRVLDVLTVYEVHNCSGDGHREKIKHGKRQKVRGKMYK